MIYSNETQFLLFLDVLSVSKAPVFSTDIIEDIMYIVRIHYVCVCLVSGSDLPYPINGLTGPKG